MRVVATVTGIMSILGIIHLTTQSPSEKPEDVILQGLPKSKLVSIVEDTGGEVIKEFKFINAISATLAPSQVVDLKEEHSKLRVTKDNQIKVSTPSSNDVLKTTRLTFQESRNAMDWRGTNTSNKQIILTALDVDFPKNNGELIRVAINNKNFDKTRLNRGDKLWFSLRQNIILQPGESVDLRLRFNKRIETNPNLYNVDFVKQELSDNSRFKFDALNNAVAWTIPLDKDYGGKRIWSIRINAPGEPTEVETILIDGVEQSFSLGQYRTFKLNNVRLKEQASLNLKVKFKELASANPSDYSALINVEGQERFTLHANNKNIVQGKQRDTFFSSIVNADKLHDMGITGRGVGVAVIDTGISRLRNIRYNSDGDERAMVFRDFVVRNKNKTYKNRDSNGHGTHVASIIANSSKTIRHGKTGKENLESYNGIAPNADLFIVRAFDKHGTSSYSRVLEAMEYVIANKDLFNIRVLNLSFSSLPSSHYWDDPLNQMVMRAWQEGIVVVAAAGNRGSGAMSVGVPGNTPYIITVGATTDNGTPYDLNDDYVPTFSSAGPTVEGFIKPELVAPGSRIQGLISKRTFIRDHFSMFDNDPFNEHDYFDLSGTSQSTAVVSGIVALMIENDPWLTPDEVKCRLMDTARIATLDEQKLAFSVFQQGMGLVDAFNAVYSTANDCTDSSMSIAKELAGEEHYIGPVRFNESTEEFEIIGAEGLEWNGLYNDSQLWRKGRFDSDSQLWGNRSFNSNSQLWRHTPSGFESNSQLWRMTSFNVDSQLWRRPRFDVNSQLWGNQVFNSDSQLWRMRSFKSNANFNELHSNSKLLKQEWTDHE